MHQKVLKKEEEIKKLPLPAVAIRRGREYINEAVSIRITSRTAVCDFFSGSPALSLSSC
jgi:hypothetical protein